VCAFLLGFYQEALSFLSFFLLGSKDLTAASTNGVVGDLPSPHPLPLGDLSLLLQLTQEETSPLVLK